MRRMHRRDLKGVPYNPRTISADARKRLKENLKEVGLLGPVMFNDTTGNVFGGHQRLALLDILEGSDDYWLDVAVSRLSPKREREQCVFLNNPGAQGDWDLKALADMFADKENPIKLEHTGFNMLELEMTYSAAGLDSIFSAIRQPEEVQSTLKELEAIAATRKADEDASTAGSTDDAQTSETAAGDKTAAASLVADMRKTKRKIESNDDTERLLIVVCESRDQCEALRTRLGCAPDDRYVPVDLLVASLK